MCWGEPREDIHTWAKALKENWHTLAWGWGHAGIETGINIYSATIMHVFRHDLILFSQLPCTVYSRVKKNCVWPGQRLAEILVSKWHNLNFNLGVFTQDHPISHCGKNHGSGWNSDQSWRIQGEGNTLRQGHSVSHIVPFTFHFSFVHLFK